ncbi:MAG: hypothetical protein ACP5N9_03230 [Candidatus Bilamarchaeum sp.]|jgi:hypothetical protein
MDDIEKLTKDTVKNGGVLSILYFDIHAKTKEAVQELGTGFINTIIHRPGVVYALGEIDEPLGGEEGKNWSSSISVKVLTKDFNILSLICMAHSPFTVEILRPEEIKLSISATQELLANMGATTAEYKKLIVTKLSSKEEIAQMQEDLKKRAEMGKKILDKKKE